MVWVISLQEWMNSEAAELEERPRMDYEQGFEGLLVWALFFFFLCFYSYFFPVVEGQNVIIKWILSLEITISSWGDFTQEKTE